ncbi:MAG: Fur family transcriptional regulator [Bacteroidales bacterium]|jgi:Fur family peroxide stress response transcriptional regulator
MVNKSTIKLLSEHGLKITPQRIAILDVIMALNCHPTADVICDHLRINHPHISIGTIYKTLDAFLSKGIIEKVLTESDTARYDRVHDKHHHLYCAETERVEDYFDDHLYQMVNDYLRKKRIKNFKMKDFKIQITGKFSD